MVKKLAYFCIITSLLGATTISVDFAFFQLSLFRLSFFTLTIFTFIIYLSRNDSFTINKKNNQSYSIMFFILWFYYSILTIAWVEAYVPWVKDIYFIGLGTFLIISFSYIFNNVNDILIGLKLFSIMSMFHIIIGIYEIYTNNYFFLNEDKIPKYSLYDHPVSIFNNTNDYATFITFAIFSLYICLKNTTSVLAKLNYVIFIFLSMYTLLMTSSRANIIALILGIIMFFIITIFIQRKTKILYALMVLISMIIAISFVFLSEIVVFITNNMTFNFSAETGSEYVRENLIKNGLIFLFETFGFGTGTGNLEYWMMHHNIFQTNGILAMHNWWVEILSTFGVAIFLLYIIFYYKILKDLILNVIHSKNKVVTSISIGMLCIMTSFTIASISSSTLLSFEWMWVFWAIIISFQGLTFEERN